jgi:tape measure domain-containing protein
MTEEVYRIEVPIHASDNTDPAISTASKKVYGFEKAMGKMEQKMNQVRRSRLEIVASAIDRATKVIGLIGAKAKSIAGKTYNIAIGVKDMVTRPLKSITGFVTSTIGMLTAGAGIAGGIVIPMRISGDFEQTQFAFETMLSSGERANRFLSEAEDFANKTPFEFPELLQSARLMKAFGFEIESVLPMMTLIGDTASGLGAGAMGIERISRALGQMKAKGRLQAGELLQLQELGVPAAEILQEELGLTAEQVGDIGREGVEAGRGIDALLRGMEKRFGGMMAKQSTSAIGLISTIKDTIQNKLLRRWGDGLWTGIKPQLGRIVDWIDRNKEQIRRWGEEFKKAGENISVWVTSGLEQVGRRVSSLVNSTDWKNAITLGEKMQLAWDKIIAEPFNDWWNGKGKVWLSEKAHSMGKGIGSVLKTGILGLLGVNTQSAVEEGANIGSSFAEGFVKGFDAKQVREAIMNALKGIVKDAATVMPGGESTSATGWLSALLLSGAFLKLGGGKLLGGIGKLGGKLTTAGAGAGIATGTTAVTGMGAAGTSIGAAAVTTGKIATAGIATPVGWAAGALGAYSAINDFIHAADTKNVKENRDAVASGISKTAMMALGGAIGTAILPGLGTAIGVGIGGIGALLYGGSLGKTISGWIDGSGKIEKTANDLRSAAYEYQNMADKAGSTRVLTREYERLSKMISEGKGTSEEMSEAKSQLQRVIESLSAIYPGLITQYDIENGKLREKLGLLNDITEADKKSAKLKLEQEVALGEKNFSKIEERFKASKDRTDALYEEKNALEKAISQFKTYEIEMMKLLQARDEEGYDWGKDSKRVNSLIDRINKVARTVGYDFSGSGLTGFAFAMQDRTFEEERRKIIDALVQEDEQLTQLRDQYSSLYEAKKKLIEFDLGSTLEDQAKKYHLLTEAEQGRFLDAIAKVSELERKMNELPTEKKINIDVLARYMSESRPNKGVYDEYYPHTWNYPHAYGGIMTKPHVGLVAEAGPEAIIPLSSAKRNRGMSLWEHVGRVFGMSAMDKPFKAYDKGGIAGNAFELPETNMMVETKSEKSAIPIPYPNTNNQTINLILQANPTYKIESAANAQDILRIIRENNIELADELLDTISKFLPAILKNTVIVPGV